MALWKKLLKAGLDPDNHTVVFMGDYTDRGGESKQVVEQLMKWHKQYPHFIFLRGNHEDILQNWVEGGQKYQEDAMWSCFLSNGGTETLKSYGLSEPIRSGFPKSHLDFLFNETKILYEEGPYAFVHGGLIPGESIDNIKKLMDPDTEGHETIINAMLWAREGFIDNDWVWRSNGLPKKIIFGHSAAYKPRWGKLGQPIVMINKIGIDGAVCPPANKNLIAVELPNEEFYFQESFAVYDLLRNI